MLNFLSTTNTINRLTIEISSQGTSQFALLRMSVNVLLGATKVSTTRSSSVSGLGAIGPVAAVVLITLSIEAARGSRPSSPRADHTAHRSENLGTARIVASRHGPLRSRLAGLKSSDAKDPPSKAIWPVATGRL